MPDMNLIATCAFGLESITALELKELGYEVHNENGLVRFHGNHFDIARTNLWLRTAERVFVELDAFKATSFEELFQGVSAIHWEDILPRNAMFPVTGKSVKSVLHSVPACQSIVKKAIVDRLAKHYRQDTFPETGQEYKIEVSFLKDIASIRIDTSGAGLHRRGYRKLNAAAPLRETLAASLVRLSRWDAHRPFADPLCGSGTIAIEAAMYGLRRAPGLFRDFSAEQWTDETKSAFAQVRQEAIANERDIDMDIVASDVDSDVLELTHRHLAYAKLTDKVRVERADAKRFLPHQDYGCIITNPPYGERMMSVEESERLYRALGRAFKQLDTWSIFLITSDANFERIYGKRADKRRKLYNGRIETQLYQYLGPLPPRRNKNDE